jgi:hypothetical protein
VTNCGNWLFLGGLIGLEPRHFENVAQRIKAIAPGQQRKFLRERCDVFRGAVGGLVSIEPVLIVSVWHLFYEIGNRLATIGRSAGRRLCENREQHIS